ncbi:MAG TPA: MOSC domain-containing protein, partial [Polyangiaceae bacterium]|nr:MOSC domain-containing protein [Polyangiaceae bacterium]
MRVSALTIYPVKACRGIDVPRARVVTRGFELDRRYMIVDAEGDFVTQRDRHELALVSTSLTPDGFELRAPNLAPLELPRAHEAGPRVRARVWA